MPYRRCFLSRDVFRRTRSMYPAQREETLRHGFLSTFGSLRGKKGAPRDATHKVPSLECYRFVPNPLGLP